MDFINNFSIKVKLVAIVLVLSLGTISVFLLAKSYMSEIGDELYAIAEQEIPLTNHLSAITESQLEQSVHLERALKLAYVKKSHETFQIQFEKEIQVMIPK